MLVCFVVSQRLEIRGASSRAENQAKTARLSIRKIKNEYDGGRTSFVREDNKDVHYSGSYNDGNFKHVFYIVINKRSGNITSVVSNY